MKCQFSLIHLFTQQYYCKSSNHIACTVSTENDGLAPWPGGTHILMTCECLSLVLNPFSLHLPSPVHVMYLEYQGNVLVCHGQQQGRKHIKNALRLTGLVGQPVDWCMDLFSCQMCQGCRGDKKAAVFCSETCCHMLMGTRAG